MTSIRNITSTILAALLVLATALSGGANAMSGDCMGAHCDIDLMMSHMSQQDTQAVAQDSAPHGLSASDHEACNLMLCHTLAFLPTSNAHQFISSEIALAWHVALPNALARAEAPDRPPNL